MAMRLFTREEWREELTSKWKLTPTKETTATTELWLTPKGRPISVPVLEEEKIPDAMLNLVEEQLLALGEHPFHQETAASRASTAPPKG